MDNDVDTGKDTGEATDGHAGGPSTPGRGTAQDGGGQILTVVGPWEEQVVFTAVHAGHDLRPEVRELMVLDEATRLREEDPHSDRIGARLASGMVMHRSRFETDLNRPRERSVYSSPEDSWGLQVWRDGQLPDEVAAGSRQVHDAWYEELEKRIARLAARGPFVVFDLHTYNHRRDGPDAPPAPQEGNPDVNVGTGTLDREPWAPVVDAFMEAMAAPVIPATGQRLDVRENVRFWGQNEGRWVHRNFPDTACVLALEFKKTFMDEWTGEVDEAHLAQLADALAGTVPAVTEALRHVRVPSP
ncbi:N-formylglutamate amidohydrolase [Citricoccus sp. SGAir0253]|uniref:N-formylglutamate amidohydrolase n=1 Tax=Citricoccus sp. SGAir0253 TaxID=2567881 RepID=UPI0010CCDD49|nr:N-formylglutamate amidohydrolase [Citricoccus sp. SGAir0253]QCU78294.1 N-formylglutamate amidohydrolase [Citricoccus sp. SGAir0253]